MQAANLHIQERIQEVRAHPPTMDQGVTIVPGGRSFEPYVCMFVGEGACSEESRSMEDYSARFNPQSVSQEAMRGSARLVGTTLVLPYNHVPHSSLGSEHEEDMDETMYGIPRDLAPTGRLSVAPTLSQSRRWRLHAPYATKSTNSRRWRTPSMKLTRFSTLCKPPARKWQQQDPRQNMREQSTDGDVGPRGTRSSYANHSGHHGFSRVCPFQLSPY